MNAERSMELETNTPTDKMGRSKLHECLWAVIAGSLCAIPYTFFARNNPIGRSVDRWVEGGPFIAIGALLLSTGLLGIVVYGVVGWYTRNNELKLMRRFAVLVSGFLLSVGLAKLMDWLLFGQ